MTLILVFFIIVFFIFGFFVMDNIDKFIYKNIQTTEESFVKEVIVSNEKEFKNILIYGDNKIATIIKDYCKEQNYHFNVIKDINDIDKKNKYLSLLALSNSDTDNLIISSIGLKVYSIPHIITLCNNRDNLKVYSEFNFEKVIMYDDAINLVYEDVKGVMENAIKNQV